MVPPCPTEHMRLHANEQNDSASGQRHVCRQRVAPKDIMYKCIAQGTKNDYGNNGDRHNRNSNRRSGDGAATRNGNDGDGYSRSSDGGNTTRQRLRLERLRAHFSLFLCLAFI